MSNSPIQQRAEDLWRASGFTAPTSEIIAKLAREGFTVTDTLLRAWKNRKKWKAIKRPVTEGKVRAARGRPKQGGNRGMRVERAATEVAVIADAMAEEVEIAGDTGSLDHLARLETVQRSLQRMAGSGARKFTMAMGELTVKSAEDALSLARAVSLVADSAAKISGVLREARLGTPNLRQFKQESSPVIIQNTVHTQAPEAAPMMRDITPPEPPPEKRLAGVLDSFRSS